MSVAAERTAKQLVRVRCSLALSTDRVEGFDAGKIDVRAKHDHRIHKISVSRVHARGELLQLSRRADHIRIGRRSAAADHISSLCKRIIHGCLDTIAAVGRAADAVHFGGVRVNDRPEERDRLLPVFWCLALGDDINRGDRAVRHGDGQHDIAVASGAGSLIYAIGIGVCGKAADRQQSNNEQNCQQHGKRPPHLEMFHKIGFLSRKIRID